MAVLGSIYGSFVQNSLSLGVSGSFWELLGVFTIIFEKNLFLDDFVFTDHRLYNIDQLLPPYYNKERATQRQLFTYVKLVTD